MKSKVELADKVKDVITGFTGIATARVLYKNGCLQFGVKGIKLEAGKTIRKWIDVEDLVVVTKARKKKTKPSGGPQNAPTGMLHP